MHNKYYIFFSGQRLGFFVKDLEVGSKNSKNKRDDQKPYETKSDKNVW